MTKVKQLAIYPVKSMQGVALQTSLVLPSGLENDRLFMVTEPNGRFITAREKPQLLQLKTAINKQVLEIYYQPIAKSLHSISRIRVKFTDFSPTLEKTQVWNNYFSSHIAPITVNQFLSEFLQLDVQLRWIAHFSNRRVKHFPSIPLGFADGHPFLLLNQASFDYLQQRCPEILTIEQFRGNIIIDGTLPFAEDGWRTIKIGEIIFDLVKPCSRCVMTQINLSTLQWLPNKEPMTTLRSFRLDEKGDIDFGMKMIARNSGKISINDPVEILTRQPAKTYIKSVSKNPKNIVKTCKITIAKQIINGNCQQPLLEQLEQQGISIPYSCRSGVCGRCRVILEDGSITAMTKSAIQAENHILACSCIPKSESIKIKLITKKT